MTKKVAIINQKGGVGKSTSAVSISYELAESGRKTLLIDLDPQGQSSAIYRTSEPRYTIKDLFLDLKFDINKAISKASLQENPIKNLDVIHSNILFAKVAEQVSSRIHREKILDTHLRRVKYDYVIFDCPSNLGVITINAITAADAMLIPVTYDKGALDGMADLFDTIKEVKEDRDFAYFILRNIYDARNKQTIAYIDNELAPQIKHVLKTKIRKAEAINQSRISSEPIQAYDKKSNGAVDYRELIKELTKYV